MWWGLTTGMLCLFGSAEWTDSWQWRSVVIKVAQGSWNASICWWQLEHLNYHKDDPTTSILALYVINRLSSSYCCVLFCYFRWFVMIKGYWIAWARINIVLYNKIYSYYILYFILYFLLYFIICYNKIQFIVFISK